MKKPLKVVIAEDSEEDTQILLRELRLGGHELISLRVETAEAFQEALAREPWDLILCDFVFPRFSGPAALRIVQERQLDLPFIFVSGKIGEDVAVEAMKAGAHDYVMKDKLARLVPAVERELRDATERQQHRRAEQALRSSESKYRHLFESMKDAAFLLEAETRRIIDTNREAEILLDCPKEAILGRPQEWLFPPGAEPRCLFTECMRENYGCETELIGPNGLRVPVHINASLVEFDNHQCILALCRDITERKRAEAERERLVRTKDQFLAMLSHELRTPLTPILSGINLLEVGAPKEWNDILEMMRRNLLLETRLINDLLDLTRLGTGQLKVELQPVDAHHAIREAVATCHSSLETRQVTLDLDAREPIVHADAGRLQQVVQNILENAARFTRPGGAIEIRTSNPTSSQFQFRCRDDGAGIDPKDLERIFKAFEQSERSVERGYGGLGLGLAISKELMNAHGGTITARSAGRGSGATFEITLRTVPAEAPPDARPSRQEDGSSGMRSRDSLGERSPLRILLVEDHADTRQTLTHLLRRFGYQVDVAENSQSARERAAHSVFDLLISDLELPDGNGLDLLAAFPQSLHAISLSGFGQERDFQESRAAGFATHLVKPVDLKRLWKAIEALRSDVPDTSPPPPIF